MGSFATDQLPAATERMLEGWGGGATGRDDQGRVYTVTEPLDRGGMGELYIASVDDPSGQIGQAVVKRILPELTDDRDFVQMFAEEAKIMSRLDHPSVVKVLGLPTIDGSLCMAMEYVVGCSAHDLTERSVQLRTALSPAMVAYLGVRVASALDHVHRAVDEADRPLDLVHRDVSPGNVLLGFDGSVKLTDFGISKSRLSQVSTTVGIIKGKARYLSPEQILGHPASPLSDIYSLGLVLVEMLTGSPLFERESIPKTLFSIVHGERPPIRSLLSSTAAPLAGVLEKMLKTDPNHRFQSSEAVAWALAKLENRLGPSVLAEDLGAYLRGLFAGSDSIRNPAPAAARGSAPLDPGAFSKQPPPVPPRSDPVEISDRVPNKLPTSDSPRLDTALSMLAWLQSKAEPDEAETQMYTPASTRRKKRPPKFGFPMGLAIGVGLGYLLAILLGSA